jgi:hypothetical protein
MEKLGNEDFYNLCASLNVFGLSDQGGLSVCEGRNLNRRQHLGELVIDGKMSEI